MFAHARIALSRHPRVLGALTAALVATLFTGSAWASVCASVDSTKDNLDESDRTATATLFRQSLEAEGKQVVTDGCTERWTVYHIKLGDSVTVVMTSPHGTRREKVNSVEDIPNVYSQMIRSLESGDAITREGSMVDRRNVRDDQAVQNRVEADSLWYLRLGYGTILGGGISGGPGFGFGYRHELDHIGIDASFLNFVLADSDNNGADGFSGSFVRLMGLYFLDPYGNSTPYFGAGLSWGGVAVDRDNIGYGDTGLQGELTVGYELLRASTIRLFGQVDGAFPFYLADGQDAQGNHVSQSLWAPTVTLSLGIGWGKSHTTHVKVDH